jgi:hypothetical protein
MPAAASILLIRSAEEGKGVMEDIDKRRIGRQLS